MTELARYEFMSLVDETANAEDSFADLEPPARLWTEDEVEAIRAEAEAKGRAAGLEEAESALETRAVEALERLAVQSESFRGDMQRLQAEIVEDAAELARSIGLRVGGEAVHDDPLAIVAPIIEQTLGQLTGTLRVVVTVNDVLKPVIQSRIEDLSARFDFDGGLRVTGGAEHLADCRIEWQGGAAERNHKALVAEVARRFETHGLPGMADMTPQAEAPEAEPEAMPGTDTDLRADPAAGHESGLESGPEAKPAPDPETGPETGSDTRSDIRSDTGDRTGQAPGIGNDKPGSAPEES